MKRLMCLWDAAANEPTQQGLELAEEGFEATGDFFVDYAAAIRLLCVLPCPSLAHAVPATTQDERVALEKAAADAAKQRQRKSRAAAIVGNKRKKPASTTAATTVVVTAPMLQPAPITAAKVRISGHVVDAGTAKAMAMALASASNPAIALSFEHVSFTTPEVAKQFVAIAAANPNIVSLEFEAAPLPLSLLQLFEPLFSPTCKLTRLSLRGTPLCDEAIAIAELLRRAQTITELDLSNAAIGDSGASAIALALRRNTTLLQLSLARNHIGDSGALDLATAIGRFQLSYEEQRSAAEKRAELENRKAALLAAKQSRLSRAKSTTDQPQQPQPQPTTTTGEFPAQQFTMSIKARKRQEQQQLEQLEQQIALLLPVEDRGGQWVVRGNRTLVSLWLSGNQAISPTAHNALLAAQKDNTVLTKLVLHH